MKTTTWKWPLIWLFFIAIPLTVITLNVAYVTLDASHSPRITLNYDVRSYCFLAGKDFSRTLETAETCMYRLGNEAGLGRNNPKNVEKRIQKRLSKDRNERREGK